ncbi:hypothetical protein DFP72DRAFT_196364 [Ephemerocybe angulata]|uniref:Uncharacterized protein n=1 Tax=Ephemerocybe angulata TaxID=980116 RepID=A0A8H6H990_9AGAR|nr:hypothetical protein DFP72DRAFT_196364 [Tulosesus angulatus]
MLHNELAPPSPSTPFIRRGRSRSCPHTHDPKHGASRIGEDRVGEGRVCHSSAGKSYAGGASRSLYMPPPDPDSQRACRRERLASISPHRYPPTPLYTVSCPMRPPHDSRSPTVSPPALALGSTPLSHSSAVSTSRTGAARPRGGTALEGHCRGARFAGTAGAGKDFICRSRSHSRSRLHTRFQAWCQLYWRESCRWMTRRRTPRR